MPAQFVDVTIAVGDFILRSAIIYRLACAALLVCAAAPLSYCGRIAMVSPAQSTGGFAQTIQQLPGAHGETFVRPDSSIIGDTWNGIFANQHLDYYVSNSQAKSDAYRYDLVWGSNKPWAWKQGNTKILTSWYMPFDADGTTNHDLNWWKSFHPDWVLYKCDKQTPAWADGLDNIPLDISNPAVRTWQLATYSPKAEEGKYTAMAFDLVGLNNANGACGVWINGVWHQRFSGQKVDSIWTQAVLNWFHYAKPYLHGLSQPLLVGANTVPEARPLGDPQEIDLLNHVDFLNDEYAFTGYGYSYVSSVDFVKIVGWMKYAQGIGKPWLVDDKWNTQVLGPQELGWSLGTYMMGKYHSASVFIDHLPGYGYEYWHPEFKAPVGYPCADMYADTTQQGVYLRKYSGGLAIVNSSPSKDYLVTLPRSQYLSLYGKTVKSPLLVLHDWGVVLLTTNGCQ
jgi:hypothetical protein